MVQVLPATPTFGNRLGAALSDASTNLISGYMKGQQERKDQDLLNQLNDPNLTPMQRIGLAAKLSKEKFASLSPILAAYEKGQAKMQEAKQNLTLYQQLFPDMFGGGEDGQGAIPQTPAQQALPSDFNAASAPAMPNSPLANTLMHAQQMRAAGGQPNADMLNVGQMNQNAPAAPQVTNRRIPTQQDIIKASLLPNPNVQRALSSERDVGLRQEAAERQLAHQQQVEAGKERRHQEDVGLRKEHQKLQIHQESKDYRKLIREEAQRARNQLQSFDTIEEALEKHKTGSLTFENFFKKYFKGTFLENLALSKEGALIEAQIPTMVEGAKSLFGGVLSDSDIAIMLGKTVDLGKDNASNKAIIGFGRMIAESKVAKERIANQVLKENKGFAPINFEQEVQERFEKKYGNKIKKDFDKLVYEPKAKQSAKNEGKTPEKTVVLIDHLGRKLDVPESRVAEIQAKIDELKAKK